MTSSIVKTLMLFLTLSSVSLQAQNNKNKLSNSYLESVLKSNSKFLGQGQLADYIPELAKANAQAIGLCIIGPNGQIYKSGNYTEKFTIQSISKIVALMIAVEDWGESAVFEKVGYYGTHLPFNDFEHLQSMPVALNPMVNAGAIVTTAMIKEQEQDAYNRILDRIRYITNNNAIDINWSVYQSEKLTGHRNRGIFHLLKNKSLLDKSQEALDNYFKQCSIEINTEDLAKIAYFFANDCVRYDGDQQFKNTALSQLILSQMLTAGMYDYSGTYSRKIGIPSKSGVGGGIAASEPITGYGIAVFSPELDPHGNSLIGTKILQDLSEDLGLSLFK